MDHNTLITVGTIFLSILIFCRYVSLRKHSMQQDELLRKQAETLEDIQEKLQEICEIRVREAQFQQDLQLAEVSTNVQKSRPTLGAKNNSTRPPERYGYAKSMFRSGMSTQEISSALGMSYTEITQILKLDNLCKENEALNNKKNTHSIME